MKLLILLTILLSCTQPKVVEKKVIPAEEKKVVAPKSIKKELPPLITPLHRNGKPISKELAKFCNKINRKFRQYAWGTNRCEKYDWQYVRRSYYGTPIAWIVYGEPEEVAANTTVIFCGVHGDEITPVKFCFDIMTYLDDLKEFPRGTRVVVAPIVTPDSFLKKYPSRTNARGVDTNRNFPTKDWKKDAHRLWKKRYRRSKRKYPGKKPMSEQETHFQVNLIKRYMPSKIISVHAPLTIIDYDGPELKKGGAHELLLQMSKDAKGYKVKNFPFFPGSLGNWAGNELKIPTYTLELPSSDNRLHKKYWKRFKNAIHTAIFKKL